jgi:asparagine synthase (glutamine-hydrolysing)
MSVQFGRWNFDGQPSDRELVRRAAALTAKYGPDGESFLIRGPVAIFYQPFHTTTESWREQQPLENSAGVVLTWDGRLDNRDELLRLLHLTTGQAPGDATIALAGYEQWGTAVFTRLVGEWALAVWDPLKQVLLLGKDVAGTRQLFYRLESNRVTWSTVLEPLLFLAERSLEISEEFIAGYLSTYPAKHLTPYRGIHAVPASSFLLIKRESLFAQEYPSFDPSDRIRYRSDADYEEHFRHVFAQAVRRRLRSSSPLLAELSGGMDSTSIVCMADTIMAAGNTGTSRLDTISYYDDSEPNWNERPYFSLVEKKRGRDGYHIATGGSDGALEPPENAPFFPLPGCDKLALDRIKDLGRCLESSGSRVLLSGIGGDEFLGGVPTSIPELQDLLARSHWIRFAKQITQWSLKQRRPLLHLWLEAVEGFLPRGIRKLYGRPRLPPWLTHDFVRRHWDVFWADTQRTRLIGPLPSFQTNLHMLHLLQRQLNLSHLNPIANHRVSYPYFDRDLLAFLFAVPREQLVRPHQRRSLMRRSLLGVVPEDILSRKRKAFVARAPLTRIAVCMPRIEQLLVSPVVAARGWMDATVFKEKLKCARSGELEYALPLIGTLQVELWLGMLVRGHHIARAATSVVGAHATLEQPFVS